MHRNNVQCATICIIITNMPLMYNRLVSSTIGHVRSNIGDKLLASNHCLFSSFFVLSWFAQSFTMYENKLRNKMLLTQLGFIKCTFMYMCACVFACIFNVYVRCSIIYPSLPIIGANEALFVAHNLRNRLNYYYHYYD